MGMEFLFSVLPRATLKPSDLVYKRRVNKADPSGQTNHASVEDYEDDHYDAPALFSKLLKRQRKGKDKKGGSNIDEQA